MPELGRFLQTDPIGYEDQVNLYAYAANDPVNGVDPTGESISIICTIQDGAVTGCTGSQVNDGVDKVYLTTRTVSENGSISRLTTVIGKESDIGSTRDLSRTVQSAFKELFNKDVAFAVTVAGMGSPGIGPRSAGNMQQQVERGQAPREIDRVDKARFPFEKDQAHPKDGRALNVDGTWKHGSGTVNRTVADWLTKNGWKVPR